MYRIQLGTSQEKTCGQTYPRIENHATQSQIYTPKEITSGRMPEGKVITHPQQPTLDNQLKSILNGP